MSATSTIDPIADFLLDALSLMSVFCAAVVLWYIAWTFFFSRIPLVVRLVGFVQGEIRAWRAKRAVALAQQNGNVVNSAAGKENSNSNNGNQNASGSPSSPSVQQQQPFQPGGSNTHPIYAPKPVFGMKPRVSTVAAT